MTPRQGNRLPGIRISRRALKGYALGAALFALAFAVTTFVPGLRSHYPYLAYFLASLSACYFGGVGAANLTAGLSTLAVYLTFAPTGFFVAATQSPAKAALSMLFLIVGCNMLVGSLKRSRDRLVRERERYARLAESRDLLYRELQHRVSNNIGVISGLLLLQSQAVGDSGARRALAEASGRINLIARIQRQLHDQTGEPTSFRRFAQDLLSDAITVAGAEAVRLEVEGGDEPLHVEQATPVSLVLLECVNNALEHAYGAGCSGVVRVTLTREDEHMVLAVRDDGKGLPEGFDVKRSKSLGLKIVRTMALQLDGEFCITPTHPGSVCRLRFPVLPREENVAPGKLYGEYVSMLT
jgi:two-component sensor histidine kinase